MDLLDATCFDDIVAAIRRRAAVAPRGESIVCTPVGEPHYFLRRDYTQRRDRALGSFARRRRWRSGHTASDGVYVALAEILDGVLLTSDGRLTEAPDIDCEVELIQS